MDYFAELEVAIAMDILYPDGINASITAFEAAYMVWVMPPEGSRWNLVLAIAVFLGSSLALWRLWTFTVRPLIHPDEAKEIPYWVPCKIKLSCAVAKAEYPLRFRYSAPGPNV